MLSFLLQVARGPRSRHEAVLVPQQLHRNHWRWWRHLCWLLEEWHWPLRDFRRSVRWPEWIGEAAGAHGTLVLFSEERFANDGSQQTVENVFAVIFPDKRPLLLAAQSQADRQEWMSCIGGCVLAVGCSVHFVLCIRVLIPMIIL